MLPERIKLLREKYGDKQTDLAKKLNVTRSSVNAWEMGISVPSTMNIREIAQLYGVSTDFLYGMELGATVDVSGLSDGEIGAVLEVIACFRNRGGE